MNFSTIQKREQKAEKTFPKKGRFHLIHRASTVPLPQRGRYLTFSFGEGAPVRTLGRMRFTQYEFAVVLPIKHHATAPHPPQAVPLPQRGRYLTFSFGEGGKNL